MRCEHQSCDCKEVNFESNGHSYCSEACAMKATAGDTGKGCNCGHPNCTGAHT